MGITDKFTSVDPAAGYDVASWIVFNNVFQSLLRFPKNSTTPEPDVAKSCKFTDSLSRTFECTVRQGLRFSNGDLLTAKDVAFSFERTLKINDVNGPAVLLESINRIEAPSSDRVVFHLKYSDATFPMKIASGAGSIVNHREYPADRLRTDGRSVGSGPYRLDSYSEGHEATFSVNGQYRGSAAVQNSGMTVRFYHDESTLLSALQNREVDLAYRGLSPADVATLRTRYNTGDAGVQVEEGAGPEIQHLVFNVSDSTVASSAVRQAVAYLIDRDEITAGIYHHTTSALYSLVPKGIIAHDNAYFNRYGQGGDKMKAAAVLSDAGITEKVSFTLWATPVRFGSGTVTEAQAIAQQLNTSGLFDIDVKIADAEEYADGITAGDYAAYIRGWVPDYPDPDNFTQPLFGAGNILGNNYKDGKVSVLIQRSAAQRNRVDASEDFRKLQEIVAEDVPVIPLWQSNQCIVAQRDIQGLGSSLDISTVFRFWEIRKMDRGSWW
ncbi:ABC transporter substrate-binding protein [Streptomyces sp. NPDC046977]|uniref:ABC transporter substrate-binding protein n=1 Tax=Streptomyces sp. NPDC046977 TaxID=3154703 RepID=UPI0033DE4E03